jgi:hypothetical protein
VDVVALNVVRRTAAYSCRLRLFEGGTLTARPVVITTGVTLPAAWRPRAGRSAESSDISRRRVGVPRREGRRKIIPAGAGWLAGPSDQQIRCCRVTGGWRRPVLAWRAGGL